MASGAIARNSRFHRLLLHQADQILERIRHKRIAADQYQGIAIDEHHRRKGFDGVKRQCLIERNIRGDLQIMDKQRVTIRRGTRDFFGTDDCTAAADILDNEALLELRQERLCNDARGLVGRAASRIGNDNGNVPAWILLRQGRLLQCTINPSAAAAKVAKRFCIRSSLCHCSFLIEFRLYRSGMIGNKRYGCCFREKCSVFRVMNRFCGRSSGST